MQRENLKDFKARRLCSNVTLAKNVNLLMVEAQMCLIRNDPRALQLCLTWRWLSNLYLVKMEVSSFTLTCICRSIQEFKSLEVLAFEMETAIASLEEQLAIANEEKDLATLRADSLASDLEALKHELHSSNSELRVLEEEVSVLVSLLYFIVENSIRSFYSLNACLIL